MLGKILKFSTPAGPALLCSAFALLGLAGVDAGHATADVLGTLLGA